SPSPPPVLGPCAVKPAPLLCFFCGRYPFRLERQRGEMASAVFILRKMRRQLKHPLPYGKCVLTGKFFSSAGQPRNSQRTPFPFPSLTSVSSLPAPRQLMSGLQFKEQQQPISHFLVLLLQQSRAIEQPTNATGSIALPLFSLIIPSQHTIFTIITTL